MSMQPFTPQGKTIAITANTTAPAAVQCPAANSLGSVTYRIANPEATETVWYTMSSDPGCNANCTIPAPGAGNSALTIPLSAGGIEVVRGPQNAYFTGVTRSAAANMFVTPGDGL